MEKTNPEQRLEQIERNISDFKRILDEEGNTFSKQLYWEMTQQVFFWNAEMRQIKWDLWKAKTGLRY